MTATGTVPVCVGGSTEKQRATSLDENEPSHITSKGGGLELGWKYGKSEREEFTISSDPANGEKVRAGDLIPPAQRADTVLLDIGSPKTEIVLAPGFAPDLDSSAQLIVRVHFARQILNDLHLIQQHCGQPTAAVYANSLLKTMRAIRDRLPSDPYVEIVVALYDALAFENNWLKYGPAQYAVAHKVLKTLARKELIGEDKVEKAIMKLEEAGFDTIPFGADVDFDAIE